MKKFLKKATLFVACVAAINLIINICTFYPVQDDRYEVRYDYLKDNLNNYNTLFFGTSRTIRHIVPSVFDSINKANGITTKGFNLGTPANKLFETYYQYDAFLRDYSKMKERPVKYVFLELNPMDVLEFQNISSRKASYWFDANYAGHLVSYLKDGATVKRGYFNYFYAFLIHYFGFNYLDNPLQETSKDANVWLGENHDGYVDYDDEIKLVTDLKQKKKLQEFRARFEEDTTKLIKARINAEKEYAETSAAKYNAEHLKMMKDIIEKSKQYGIEVKFIIQPRLASYREIHAIKKQLPGYVIDVADPNKHRELWEVKNAFDKSHMNKKGSTIFTALLSRDFLEMENHKAK